MSVKWQNKLILSVYPLNYKELTCRRRTRCPRGSSLSRAPWSARGWRPARGGRAWRRAAAPASSRAPRAWPRPHWGWLSGSVSGLSGSENYCRNCQKDFLLALDLPGLLFNGKSILFMASIWCEKVFNLQSLYPYWYCLQHSRKLAKKKCPRNILIHFSGIFTSNYLRCYLVLSRCLSLSRAISMWSFISSKFLEKFVTDGKRLIISACFSSLESPLESLNNCILVIIGK